VTLAPAVGRAEIEFRRDTGIYSSEELSTPADFQRTSEYRSLYSDDAVGSRLSAGACGPSGPGGRPSPARYGAPESPGNHAADRSASEQPSYVTESRGGRRRQADRPSESHADDLERDLAEIRRQLAEMRSESTPGVSPGLSRVDRIGPDQTGTAPEQSVMDGSAATRPETTRRSGPARPTVNLGTYNGITPLETFLAKFENCSDYYGWDARERVCHLRACL